jgi:hypothetical protein
MDRGEGHSEGDVCIKMRCGMVEGGVGIDS